jgi:hypothetical protein
MRLEPLDTIAGPKRSEMEMMMLQSDDVSGAPLPHLGARRALLSLNRAGAMDIPVADADGPLAPGKLRARHTSNFGRSSRGQHCPPENQIAAITSDKNN